ncbi:MAG: ABC transporter permease [Hyphomicrobiales bacterium]|nr:ABC transporter permease [Hyphomicrobiales bacterium]MCP4999035.1 ABC transporter permease [Hyphomicrobiales bacterium]
MEFLVNWLANIPGFALPFALGALGLIICEKSGVLNLGAEGFLLIGAMAGAGAVLTFGGYPLLALAMAALASALLSLVFAVLVILLRVNQVISGLTIVFLAQGLTSLIALKQGWTNKAFTGLSSLDLGPLSDIPFIGPIVFSQDLIVYLTVGLFFLAVHLMGRTNAGLRLRAVGENPDAADAAGINVTAYRFVAVLIGALLLGLAGGYLTVVVSKIWVDGLTGGRGWIAIALVIFARWRIWRALGGAVLFGCIEALIPRVAAIGVQVPQYFVLMTPYVVTFAVMVWTSLSSNTASDEPGALGRPFVREERH